MSSQSRTSGSGQFNEPLRRQPAAASGSDDRGSSLDDVRQLISSPPFAAFTSYDSCDRPAHPSVASLILCLADCRYLGPLPAGGDAYLDLASRSQADGRSRIRLLANYSAPHAERDGTSIRSSTSVQEFECATRRTHLLGTASPRRPLRAGGDARHAGPGRSLEGHSTRITRRERAGCRLPGLDAARRADK